MIAAKGRQALHLQLNKFLLLMILSHHGISYAMVLTPKNSSTKLHQDVEEMITGSFYEQLYKRSYKIPKSKKAQAAVESPNKGKRGKLIIEEMKQRNREKLAIMRGVDPTKVKQGSDIVKMQQADNKEIAKKISELSKSDEWQKLAESDIADLKQKVMVDFRAWRRKHLPTLKEWEDGREKYLGKVDQYKKTLADIPLILPVSEEEKEKEVGLEIKKEHHIVPSALALYVRDQAARATCASFAAIRGVEVMLAQHERWYDLSEQYFYWSSKPDCRKSPCDIKGSWLGHGLKYSSEANQKDIPLEKDCPYVAKDFPRNETQVPLTDGCKVGKVKVKNFTFNKTLDEVINKLDANKAVTAGIKLTPNFYKNEGIIFESEKDQGGQMDFHAAGHTVLIVGYLKLPQIFNEGKVCFIVANSWGIGWGRGGYACISEKWMLNHRSLNPFVSIESIEI